MSATKWLVKLSSSVICEYNMCQVVQNLKKRKERERDLYAWLFFLVNHFQDLDSPFTVFENFENKG